MISLIFVFSTTARYIYQIATDRYLTSKNFYFDSDLLSATYNPKDESMQIVRNDWNGNGVYKIAFKLYSFKNSTEKLDYDLNYTLKCSIEDKDKEKIICTLYNPASSKYEEVKDNESLRTSKDDGVIYVTENNTANEAVYIIPQQGAVISKTDVFYVTVVATGIGSFEKVLTAKFKIVINANSVSVEIDDKQGDMYLTANLKSYNATPQDVKVTCDPKKFRIDATDKWYLETKRKVDAGDLPPSYIETERVGDIEYVKSFRFTMPRESLIKMRFYKAAVGSSGSYTYPNYTYKIDGGDGPSNNNGKCVIELIEVSD